MTSPPLAISMRGRGRAYPLPPRAADTFETNRWGSVDPDNIPPGVTMLPSVTTILSVVHKNLVGYGGEHAIRAGYENGWPDDVEKAVELFKWAANKHRDERADAGTRAHTLAERLTRDLPLPASISEEDEAFADAYMAFWKNHDPTPLHVEATVYGDGYAGTADVIAEIGGVATVVDWKGLDLDTPLPTPTGWTTIRNVQPGDQVIGGDGRPCVVTAKSDVHQRDCYRLTFDDGSSIVADNEHLWQFETGLEAPYDTKILATEDIAGNLREPIRGQRHLRIPYVSLDLPDADLPLDPYVLGVWLGDGAAADGVICKPLPALFEEIERRGYKFGPDYARNNDKCTTRCAYGLRTQLRQLGLLQNKHVPDLYMRASRKQRLELLRGIMDTDGYWNSLRKRCVLETTSERFARDTYELAISLGYGAATFATTTTGFGKTWDAWQTWFTPHDEVFLMRRPADFRASKHFRSSRRILKSVDRTVTVATQCIQVDSPDSTYLCGKQMVRTHNTKAKVDDKKIKKWGCLYETTRMQLAALAHADKVAVPDGEGWRLEDPPFVVQACGVILLPDGTYRCEWLDAYDLVRWYAGFDGARRLWKAMKGAAA